MKRLIPQFLIVVFWLGTLPSASAQNATLVVYNNTDATLDVFAGRVYTGSIITSTVRVPPGTRMTFTGFLPRGSVEVVAEAPFVRPRLGPISVRHIVSGASPRTREWENFPSSFGTSFMADPPSRDPIDSDAGVSYARTVNAGIPGHNRDVRHDLTVRECMEACTGHDWCKSFDYHENDQICYLQDVNASDVGGLKTDYRGDPYDHYERQ